MLVNAVDGVTLDDGSVPRVVVPPPLPRVALQLADPFGASLGRRHCAERGQRRMEPGERLNRVDLVREATDVGAPATRGSGRQDVREQAALALALQQPLGREADQSLAAPVPSAREACSESPCAVNRLDGCSGPDLLRQSLDERLGGEASHLGRRPGCKRDGADVGRAAGTLAYHGSVGSRVPPPEHAPLGLGLQAPSSQCDDGRIAKIVAQELYPPSSSITAVRPRRAPERVN